MSPLTESPAPEEPNDEPVVSEEPLAASADPNPLGVDVEKAAVEVSGGEGHGSANARQLVVIQKLPERENMKPAERLRLLDPDIREAMVICARRLNAEAMKYSNVGFEWNLDDIAYDIGGPRTVVATLRIARDGA